jgi:hypothetical protein
VVLIHGQEFTHLRRSLQSSRCEEVRFARDSPLEGSGFELSVPLAKARNSGPGIRVIRGGVPGCVSPALSR